jgi:hypothetical protein
MMAETFPVVWWIAAKGASIHPTLIEMMAWEHF